MRSLITVILASSTEYAYICKMATSSREESHKDTVNTTTTTTTTIIDRRTNVEEGGDGRNETGERRKERIRGRRSLINDR